LWCVNWANIKTCAAVNAIFFFDYVFCVAFRNTFGRASRHTYAAVDAIIVNYISHRNYLHNFIYVLILYQLGKIFKRKKLNFVFLKDYGIFRTMIYTKGGTHNGEICVERVSKARLHG